MGKAETVGGIQLKVLICRVIVNLVFGPISTSPVTAFTRRLRLRMPNSRQLRFRMPIFALVSGDGEPAMKMLWCWRCKAEVPMLDDDEFKRVSSLRNTGTQATFGSECLARSYANINASRVSAKQTRTPFITTCCLCTDRHVRGAESRCVLRKQRFVGRVCSRLAGKARLGPVPTFPVTASIRT